MQAKSNILSEKEFCSELIDRFFHPNSYFMHCINHIMDTSVGEASDGAQEHYLLLGGLLDRLINAPDKLNEIERISEIGGMDEFRDELLNGVKHLRVADLDAEKMKIEIESLAQNLFYTAFKALENQHACKELKSLLDIPDPEMQTAEDIESPSEDPVSEPDLVEADDSPSTPNEEKDFLHFSDTDVAEMGGFENSDSEEGGSKFFSATNGHANGNGTALNTNPGMLTGEPESLVGVFRRDVKSKLARLREYLDIIERKPDRLLKCSETFDGIHSSAMIYGFDTFETIACKARVLIKRTLASELKISSTRAALTRVSEIMASLLEQEPELTDADSLQKAVKLLQDPDAAATAAEPAPSSKKKQIDDIAEFKLPGEDDDDIRSLVQEITKADKKRLRGKAGMPFSVFQEEARIFFVVIGEAIDVLEKKPDDEQAFDDIQLACHSLVEVASKCDRKLAIIPELLLEIAKNVNRLSYLISETDHQLLSEAFRQYRNLTAVDDLNHPDIVKAVELLASLNLKTEMFSKENLHAVSHITTEDASPVDVLR